MPPDEVPADLADPLVVSETRRIDAPAAAIFEVLRDPRRHPEVDATGMVVGTEAPPVERVGDAFVMRMRNDEFGDYEMRNHVVEYEEDRAIAWAPKRHDLEEEDWDHRWGWRLQPDGASTVLTAFFDGTRLPEDGRRILRDGERWRGDLAASLERLESLVTRPR